MNSDIYINTELMDDKLVVLKKYRDDMKEKLTNIHNDIKDLPDTWSGKVGDSSYEILDKYSNNFEDILNKIEEFIDFFEKAKKSYETLDKGIDKKASDDALVSALE